MEFTNIGVLIDFIVNDNFCKGFICGVIAAIGIGVASFYIIIVEKAFS